MGKDLPKQPQPTEEVDLGQLFKLIGNAFSNLFKFIETILKRIYDALLLLLIHLFKRLKWYVLAVIVGTVIGYFIDANSEYVYGASMQVETNYKSARQVYENINYLNQLASVDRDSIELANRLRITPNEAAAIQGFSINPNIDENDKMKLFSDFRAQLDSLTKSSFTYNDYVEGLSSYSFHTHQIDVISTDKLIFSKLNGSLAKELSSNTYLDELKEVSMENIKRTEVVLEKQTKAIDSFNLMYLDIRKKESEKEDSGKLGSGTNIILGDAGTEKNLLVDETRLLERKLDLERERIKLYLDLVMRKYVINVISEFPAAGYDIGKLSDKSVVRLPLIFALITFIIFTGIGLKKYLDREEQRLLK